MILGIESTAHTLGIGICHNDEILANELIMFKPKAGGIHPREAAEHHATQCGALLNRVIEIVGKEKFEQIEAIAYAKGPGMAPCLQVGLTLAKTLAKKLNIPLVGVNHCIAHIEIGKLATNCKDPVTLYVSGGNTQVIACEGKRYRVFGETLDISVGNLFDQFAREAGLPHPGGPKIEKEALKSSTLLDLPYVVKGMDLSFSGILTESKKRLKQGDSFSDLCYSLQQISFSMLTEVTERAMAHTEKNEVLIVGGVAANNACKEMLSKMAQERGGDAYAVPMSLACDNGAMIAYLGQLMFDVDIMDQGEDIFVTQRFRTDEVDVSWL